MNKLVSLAGLLLFTVIENNKKDNHYSSDDDNDVSITDTSSGTASYQETGSSFN